MVRHQKYRNSRELEEMEAMEEAEAIGNEEIEIMSEEPKTVEDAIFKKRYADSRRGFQEYKTAKEAEVEDLKQKLEHAYKSVIKAPTSEDEVIEWQKKYPEFAGILETLVQKRISEGLRESKTKLEKIEERQKELEVQEAVIALKKVHPDFDELVNDEHFHGWLSSQPKKYQEAIYNDLDVDAASFVIDKYKLQKDKKSKKVEDFESREDAAKVVRTSSVAPEFNDDLGDYEFSESQIEKESRRNPRWFDQNEEKIMRAYRTNKIKMDITGSTQ